MSRWGSPDAGSGRGRVATAQPNIWRNAGWALLQALALVALGYAGWRLVGSTPYRIDIDVYRMGGQAWLDGHPLYSHDAKFHTPIGLNLPFTYPPLAAVIFAPFAWLGMPAASVTITLITLALLLVSTMIVLTRTGRVGDLTRGARAGVVAPLVADRADRGRGDDLAGADQGELRLRADQRRADDAGDRRLRAAPHAVAAWAAAGAGHRAQAHSGGVSAVLPAAPRPPGRAHLAGVRRGCDRWPGSRWPGRTRGSTGPTPCATPIGSARRV